MFLIVTILCCFISALPLSASDEVIIACGHCGGTNNYLYHYYTHNAKGSCINVYRQCDDCKFQWYSFSIPHEWEWNSGQVKYCAVCGVIAVNSTR